MQNFMYFPPGVTPSSQLVLNRDGNFYVSTFSDGKKGGTLAQISPTGRYKTVHQFEWTDAGANAGGSTPQGIILVGDDGSIYGIADEGGAYGKGLIYRFALDGTFSVLYTITGEEGEDCRFLAFGPNGDLYACLNQPGSLGSNGAVIKITPAGEVSVVKAFEIDTIPREPQVPYTAPLANPTSIQFGPDGALYIGCYSGGYTTWSWYQPPRRPGNWGPSHRGGVARLDLETGEYEEFTEGFTNLFHPFLYDFNIAGQLYGMLDGTVFRCSLEGEASLPPVPKVYHMIKGSDGNMYGESTDIGGTYNEGTIFKLTPDDTVTTIHNYPPEYPQDNRSGIAEGNDGYLYEIVVPSAGANKVSALSRPKADEELGASRRVKRERIGVVRMKLFDLLKKRNLPPMAKRDIVPLSSLVRETGTSGYYSMSINVLSNDRDTEKGALNLISVTQGSHGQVQIDSAAKKVIYRTQTPGPDSFTYFINDSNGGQSVGTVKIAPDLVGEYAGTLVSPDGNQAGSLKLTIPARKAQKIKGSFVINGVSQSFTAKLDSEGRIIVMLDKGLDGDWPVSVELVPSLDGTDTQFVGTVFQDGIRYQTSLSR